MGTFATYPGVPAPHGPGVGGRRGVPLRTPSRAGIRAGRAVGLHHPRQRGGALKKEGRPLMGNGRQG